MFQVIKIENEAKLNRCNDKGIYLSLKGKKKINTVEAYPKSLTYLVVDWRNWRTNHSEQFWL